MKLVNKEAFGSFVPGDELDVPDGTLYDAHYWNEVAEAVPEMTVTDTVEGDK